MAPSVLVCGAVCTGLGEEPGGRAEILVEDGRIAAIGPSVDHPDDAETIDLSEHTVCPGFIDTHVHLTMDAGDLGRQTLASSSAQALEGLRLAQEYLRYGFTTLRDLGTMDPEFPTVDLRNALGAGHFLGPRLIVAGHVLSSTAGHGDVRGFYAPRWDLPVAAVEPSVASFAHRSGRGRLGNGHRRRVGYRGGVDDHHRAPAVQSAAERDRPEHQTAEQSVLPVTHDEQLSSAGPLEQHIRRLAVDHEGADVGQPRPDHVREIGLDGVDGGREAIAHPGADLFVGGPRRTLAVGPVVAQRVGRDGFDGGAPPGGLT
jgi:hypothetical protein